MFSLLLKDLNFNFHLLNDTTLRRYALNIGPVALLLGYHTPLDKDRVGYGRVGLDSVIC